MTSAFLRKAPQNRASMADTLTTTQKNPAWVSALSWLNERPVIAYVLTLSLVTLVFFLMHAWLEPTFGHQTLYLFLVAPVLLAGIAAGFGPGLAATVYAMGLQIVVAEGYQTLADPGGPYFVIDTARAITFALVGVGVAWFGERLKHAHLEAATSAGAAIAPCRRSGSLL